MNAETITGIKTAFAATDLLMKMELAKDNILYYHFTPGIENLKKLEDTLLEILPDTAEGADAIGRFHGCILLLERIHQWVIEQNYGAKGKRDIDNV